MGMRLLELDIGVYVLGRALVFSSIFCDHNKSCTPSPGKVRNGFEDDSFVALDPKARIGWRFYLIMVFPRMVFIS